MKKVLLKSRSMALIAILAILLSATCNHNPFARERDNNNNNLLLLALFLANQTPEWTVSVTASLRQANGTAIATNHVATLAQGSPVATSIQASEKALIVTAGQVNRSFVSTAAAGRFTISFRVSAQSTPLRLNFTTLRAGGNPDAADDYTTAAGNSTFTFTANDSEPTNLAQVGGKTDSGVILNIERVISVRRGTYSNPNPTVGENLCDGVGLGGTPVTKSGTINSAETWSGGIILSGTVTANAPITIEPGTVIFGTRGSSLFVLGANRLRAIGTAARPICWTSSNAPGSRFPGDWGGIVTVGNSGATRTSNTEGTTPQPYGSGSLPGTQNLEMEYNIIEFGGNEVAPGDELNNLSMYSSNSSLRFVQTHRGLDDQFEAWGGQGTWSRLLATGGLDDDYDLDEGFRGTLTNLVSAKYPDICGGSVSTDPHAFEMDGTHAVTPCPAYGCTQPTIRFFTLVGANIAGSNGMRLREGFGGTIQDGVAFGFSTATPSITGGGFSQSSFPANTYTLTNVGVDRTISLEGGTGGTANLTGFSIASRGNIDTCGFGVDKPDFTLTGGQTAFIGATGDNAGRFWEGWAVYRAR